MAKVVKTNIPFLMKETHSGAIINTNKAALDAYKAKRKQNRAKMAAIDAMEQEIITVKAEIQMELNHQKHQLDEIKNMLASVLGKNNG